MVDTSRPGVLPYQSIRELIDAGFVRGQAQTIDLAQIQPASLDLRLGAIAYRLQSSFLPGKAGVDRKLRKYAMETLDLRDGAVLERNRPYLIPLVEELELPAGIRARANPKSSTGRIDVLTRVVTEEGSAFDEIPYGYRGRLYVELVSRTFTIKVQSGYTLNQARFVVGEPRYSDDELREFHRGTPLVFRGSARLKHERLNVSDGLILSVDLSSPGIVGYRAKPNSALLDLSKREFYDPTAYWEELRATPDRSLILEPEDFYLLVSWERVQIPPSIAVEMAAYDPTSGELRTHYAGFFDPGFGHSVSTGWTGTPAVLEVRAHDVPFILEHGQRLCRLTAERMQSLPTNLYGVNQGSRYQRQHLALGPQFRQGESHHLKGPGRPKASDQPSDSEDTAEHLRWEAPVDVKR